MHAVGKEKQGLASRELRNREALGCHGRGRAELLLDASQRWKKGRLHLPARWRGRAGRCSVREEEGAGAPRLKPAPRGERLENLGAMGGGSSLRAAAVNREEETC
jgi:hypothetical protein